jgi:hypothetical protein
VASQASTIAELQAENEVGEGEWGLDGWGSHVLSCSAETSETGYQADRGRGPSGRGLSFFEI